MSPGASSDGNSHVGAGLGYSGNSGTSTSPYMSAVAAHAAQSPYAMSNNSQLSGGNYSQNYPTSHSYFGTMEASYLPSVPFHAASGHGSGMNDISMVGQHNHAHSTHHHSATQSHGGSHQFMSQSYPYHHHHSVTGGVNSYPATSECVDYSKDSTWKFQVL